MKENEYSAYNKEVDDFLRKMSDTSHLMNRMKPNPLTLYASVFTGEDGVKRGCVYTSRPVKGIIKFVTFLTDKNGSAVDKVSDFMKRNKVADYKLIQ